MTMRSSEHKHTNAAQKTADIAPPERTERVLILDQVLLEHGPAALIGRFLLKAEHAARMRGVTLTIEPIGALGDFTRQHLPMWPPLPMFDPMPMAFPNDSAFCIIGRDVNGAVVATQAVRAYNWPTSCLRDEAENLSLFYGSGDRPEGARCAIAASAAASITGMMAYSGGGWYATQFRGRDLSAILPRLSRALALARWNTDFTVSFVDWKLVHKGIAARYGYKNVDDGVRIEGIVDDTFDAALVWMSRAELIDDLSAFVETFDAPSDGFAQNRRADQVLS